MQFWTLERLCYQFWSSVLQKFSLRITLQFFKFKFNLFGFISSHFTIRIDKIIFIHSYLISCSLIGSLVNKRSVLKMSTALRVLRPDCARCFWYVIARVNIDTSTDPLVVITIEGFHDAVRTPYELRPGRHVGFFGTTKYALILYLFYLRRSNRTVSERTYIIVPMV